jgi:ABC-2 type transport system permease protein
MKAFDIAVKNLKHIFRDKKVLLVMVLIPIFYYSLMGMVFGKSGGVDISQYTVGFINGDLDSDVDPLNPYQSIEFIIEAISNASDDKDTGLFQLRNLTLTSELGRLDLERSITEANRAMIEEGIVAFVVFEAGFQATINAAILNVTQSHPKYTLYFLSSTNPTTVSIITQTFNAMVEGIINYNPYAIRFDANTNYTEGRAINNLTYSSPGYLLYGVLNIMSFAMILLTTELKEGQFKRLLSSRMKSRDLLLGNIIANTFMTFIQIGVGVLTLMAWGMTPYYANAGHFIGGIVLNTMAISFVINGIALALVPVFKTPDAAAGGVWIILIPLMTFSGVFFPVEFMSESIANAVRWIPTRMTVLAYQAVMINGLPMTDMKYWGNVLGQFAYAIGLFLLGVYMFQRFTRNVGSKQKIEKNTDKVNRAN